ncbi:hypothetical protein ACFQZQ_00385 [Lysobacter koreensis]|uniref:Uncharacterized protein n=1 Tax=Lysobacter koreensis TaxID=266122 RepID=A0ABW2YJU1_9GAMM
MATRGNPTGSMPASGGAGGPDEGLDENERVLTFELPRGRLVTVRVGLSSAHPAVNPPRPRRLGDAELQHGLDEDLVLGVSISIDEDFQSHPEVSGPQPGINP